MVRVTASGVRFASAFYAAVRRISKGVSWRCTEPQSDDEASLLAARLVEMLSRMLDSDERLALRGDLEESGETGLQAVWDVLGLVARQQAALWKDWRPWLALV
jgi:hypothetical protein